MYLTLSRHPCMVSNRCEFTVLPQYRHTYIPYTLRPRPKRNYSLNAFDFRRLSLRTELLDNLQSLGYRQMTDIQAKSLPAVLAGKDVIAQGETGSGKTAAFGLGILNRLNVNHWRVQALVLCPTRELADQVAASLRMMARTQHNVKVLTLCGGVPFGPQVASLAHRAHVVVGTPGRVEEHARKRTLDLRHLAQLVLDEADRMLEMGFQPALDSILEQVPPSRQTLLFSATFPRDIGALADRVMSDPVVVKLDGDRPAPPIEQVFYRVADESERLVALKTLLRNRSPERAIVFCQTKDDTKRVAQALGSAGFSALALNGDMEQKQRDQALVRFAHRSLTVLVATDVAARGIDIDALELVVNFQPARETEVHVHRVGRTGRAGRTGTALTLYSDREHHRVKKVAEHLGEAITPQALPASNRSGPPIPPMVTLQLDAGRKQKIRPGDVLGALTGKGIIEGTDVGKITLHDTTAFVSVSEHRADAALETLQLGKLKGRKVRARRL